MVSAVALGGPTLMRMGGSATGGLRAPIVPLTILFMHGLESGPNGSKHRWLEKTYGQQSEIRVECPDMCMSVWRMDRKNSFLRSLIAAQFKNPFRPWRTTLNRSLDNCLEACIPTLRRMRHEENSVLVASSWGGSVAIHALARGEWRGATVLLAPAFALCIRKFYPAGEVQRVLGEVYKKIVDRVSAEARKKSVIIHAPQDELVPYEDSKQLSEATGIPLVCVEGGDHRLNGKIMVEREGKPAILQEILDSLIEGGVPTCTL